MYLYKMVYCLKSSTHEIVFNFGMILVEVKLAIQFHDLRLIYLFKRRIVKQSGL